MNKIPLKYNLDIFKLFIFLNMWFLCMIFINLL